MGDVAIIGDLNCRVGKQQEVHFNIDTDSNNADITKPVLVIPRNNYDFQVNAHGRKLLQIMTNHNVFVGLRPDIHSWLKFQIWMSGPNPKYNTTCPNWGLN